ncbi:hypothetical protein [Rhodopseudomonas sp. BAL398]|uniref:thermonuclease family protein n=1 Tax=Rhodopseudomonas sp. BAL398 TaxID=3034676 RepID=UPI0023E095D2|nr:hypothetical protein [Rhodopseudomonas sp. BAL398]MDF3811870.1 hypothetical protein [Rhodopseudomonas sp. BAL398]
MIGPRTRFLALTLTWWMFAGAMSRAASPCSLAPQGEGQVIAVIDPRGLRLQDGGEVKLVGIEPALPRGDGMAALADLVAGRQVTLRGDSDAPDRYGRQPAFVFLGADADAASAQRQLVGGGGARGGGAHPPGARRGGRGGGGPAGGGGGGAGGGGGPPAAAPIAG